MHRRRRVTLVIIASIVGVLALALGAVLTVGGLFVPAVYLEPWSPEYAHQFADPRMKVVAQALLAPSGHNMQPWIVKLDASDPHALDLYVDSKRLTLAVDPLARQTLVSQGTFLAYLRVAAAHLGYAATFQLFPRGKYDENDLVASMSSKPVARVTIARDPTVSTQDFASLFLSDSNRAPYSDSALTTRQMTALEQLPSGTSATLQVLSDRKDVATLGAFGTEGTLIETRDAAATAESDRLFSSTEQAKNTARSGFAVEGQGTSGFMMYLLQGLITIIPSINDDASGAKNAIALTAAGVAHTPAYVLIRTPSNSRAEQVQAGILYADLSLRARTLGLVMQPLSQVLQEYPAMAGPYGRIKSEYASSGQTIQMLVRIGTPTVQYPVTMRRDASQLVR
jgi:hypothetical protein